MVWAEASPPLVRRKAGWIPVEWSTRRPSGANAGDLAEGLEKVWGVEGPTSVEGEAVLPR